MSGTFPRLERSTAARCPCHNMLFPTAHDMTHHMQTAAFASIGTADYQQWMDTMDVHAPLPRLLPPPPNFTLRRLTESYKLRTKDTAQPPTQIHPQQQQPQRSSAERSLGAAGPSTARGAAPPKFGSPQAPRLNSSGVASSAGDASAPQTARSLEATFNGHGAESAADAAVRRRNEDATERHNARVRAVHARVASERPALAALVADDGALAHRLLRYVVHFGGPDPRDDLAPSALTESTHAAIASLFAALDCDGDGAVSAKDLDAGAVLVGETYAATAFRKIDKARSGSVDAATFLRAFFPRFSAKRIAATVARMRRATAVVQTTRDLLSAEHCAEIDRMYALFEALPGGCTLDNMAKLQQANQRQASRGLADVFAKYDANGDGILTLDEFTELVKAAFPPFAQKAAGSALPNAGSNSNTNGNNNGNSSGTAGNNYNNSSSNSASPRSASLPVTRLPPHPLDADVRVFAPTLQFALAPVRPFGSSEMLVAAAHKRHAALLAELRRREVLLHVSPAVRRFVALLAGSDGDGSGGDGANGANGADAGRVAATATAADAAPHAPPPRQRQR